MELPKTEEELQAIIDENVARVTKDLESKHANEMAGQRKSYETKIEKIKAGHEADIEDRATAIANEKIAGVTDELNGLRSYKRGVELEKRLEKEGLPKYFANDNRLLSAEEGTIDSVLKIIKTEYEGSLPRGTTHSTVVPTSTGGNNPTVDNKGIVEFGETIKNLVK